MSTVALLRDHMDDGLSEKDLRLANAILYARFRGLFSGVTKASTPEGQVSLVVWGGVPEDGPLFKLLRWSGHYAAIDETSDTVYEADSLEDLLDEVRKQYPPSAPI